MVIAPTITNRTIFVTKDLGETWTSVSGNLPEGNVNVVREDPKNRNLLYAGHEYGFYISLNGGGEWKRFMNGLPTVRIDDVLVHPRENDLVLGTHGRSIWIMDDISALQQLSSDVTGSDAHVFDVRPATAWVNDFQRAILIEGAKHFRGQNPPRGSAISYWLKTAPTADLRIMINDVMGREIRSIDGTKEAGLNRVQWDLAPAGGRGRGGRGGGGGAPAAAAGQQTEATGQPAGQSAASQATAGQPTAGQPAAGQAGATAAAQPAQAQRGGGGGGGRGGLARRFRLAPI